MRAVTVMSRLDLLRMKRTASSYGQPLTLLEQLELDRLEAALGDSRHVTFTGVDAAQGDPLLGYRGEETLLFDV